MGTIDLSALDGANGFRIDGIDAYDQSGGSVSSAGDVNGDGFDDIVIGAEGSDGAAGASYVVFGYAGGFAPSLDLASLDGSNGFRIDGVNAYDYSGRSVSSAGDVNGDGFDDIIIGAQGAYPGGDSNAGASYVVFGHAGGFAPSLDLGLFDGTNGFRLDGIDASDASGTSVSSAGDVNGDGFDDIVIGAPFADPGDINLAGESYVVFGKAGGFAASFDLASLDGANGFRIDGIDGYDQSGRSVSSAGDVNGDGFDDIVIGAHYADPGDSNAGESYVVFGAKVGGFAPSLGLASLDGSNGFRIDGIDAYDLSGFSVSSAGDVNGDGFDDIIVGAYLGDAGDSNAGESYVVFGKADGFGASLDLGALDGSNGFRIDGIEVLDRSGRSVSSAGDVNGDSFDDILIGVPFGDPGDNYLAGESYVVFGKAGGFAPSFDLASLDGSNGFRLDGIDAYDNSGRSVASAGDVNGDGFDDIIVGAYGGDPNGDSSAGESYVVFGSGAGDFPAVLSLDGLGAASGGVILGVDAGDESGYSVASAGDVNGDGFDDIVVGAPTANPNGDSLAGESYVVFGSGAGFAASIDLAALDGSNGFRIDGVDAYDYSGISVASAGDVNGDGFDDIVVGAPTANPNGDSLAGESYVVFGSGAGFAASIDLAALDGSNGFRIDGVDAYDYSGISVASAGDVNGDGFDDIIVGAFGADPNGDSLAGESYVVFGSDAGSGATLDLAALDGSNGFRIDGIDAYDISGHSVASAGDVNGDGFDDIIVGAFGADSNGDSYAGESYVVFGSGAGFAASLDLAALDGTNGFRIDGVDAIDASGFSIASAGDVNGDGFDDIIVGAHYADPNGDSLAGESYVVFGSGAGFAAGLDLASLDGSNGFRIDGIDAGDGSGNSVASAGDVNGDGFDDIIVGASRADPNGDSYAGESYVVFGSGAGFAASLDLAALDGSNGFRIDGIDDYDSSGVSVASAGDVNGDGFDDIIVGAPGADPNGDNSGETYIIYGRAPTEAVTRVGAAGDQTIRGGAFDDRLSGLGGDDMLHGGEGDDVLNGGTGDDDMAGGIGDDMYAVRQDGDRIVEALDQGHDIARAFVDHILADHVEELRLRGAARSGTGNGLDNILLGSAGADLLDGLGGEDRIAGGADGDTISGGEGADSLKGDAGADVVDGGDGGDTLIGGVGNDSLDGGEGTDVLRGQGGDDFYVVDDAGDRVVEWIGRGIDSVEASIDYRLGWHVENLTLAGAEAIRGTGNGFDNVLTGNSAANPLAGLGGADRLIGGAGGDSLDGGAGADILRGQSGDDFYVVDDAGDRVVEWIGRGIDTVEASIDYRLGWQVENLTLAGTEGIRGTGNGFDNVLTGNSAANPLAGLGGADRLSGGEGGDRLIGGVGADVLTGGGGADRFHFNDGESAALAADADRITDFTRGEDRINIARVDADGATGADDRFSFIGTDAFSGRAAGELRFELVGDDAFVEADTDGDGSADFSLWIDNMTTVQAGDFFL